MPAKLPARWIPSVERTKYAKGYLQNVLMPGLYELWAGNGNPKDGMRLFNQKASRVYVDYAKPDAVEGLPRVELEMVGAEAFKVRKRLSEALQRAGTKRFGYSSMNLQEKKQRMGKNQDWKTLETRLFKTNTFVAFINTWPVIIRAESTFDDGIIITASLAMDPPAEDLFVSKSSLSGQAKDVVLGNRSDFSSKEGKKRGKSEGLELSDIIENTIKGDLNSSDMINKIRFPKADRNLNKDKPGELPLMSYYVGKDSNKPLITGLM